MDLHLPEKVVIVTGAARGIGRATALAFHVRLTRHIGDFTHWKNHDDYQKGLTRLLRDLKASS